MTFQQLTWPEDLNNDLEQLNMLVRGDINSYSMEKTLLHPQRRCRLGAAGRLTGSS
ncbi:PAS domain-containing protein [Salmonella enterica subsp. enterica]|uniref:PAS domain-containing protein n=1 Tax=Salmonella enterica I TaxID=59201 RepID=A0A3S4GJ42_SALET|nr:PAS domain-containing protein [Salmonella enterica subsp. enterica]